MARRKRSAGMACQPCKIMRVARGRLRNTWASTTPCRPKIDKGGRPRPVRAAFTGPARPKTAKRPRTATTTGNRKGAAKRRISSARAAKWRRASARARGMAKRHETSAESAACTSVKRSAAPSAGPSDQSVAWPAVSAALPRVSAATASPRKAAVARAVIGPARLAIPRRLHRAARQPPLVTTKVTWPAGSGFQTLAAGPPPKGWLDTSSWLSG